MKLLLSILILASTATSFAQDAQNLGLGDYMRKMGVEFGGLAAVSRNKKITEKELNHVEALQTYIAEASLIYPDSAVDETSKLEYANLMARLMKEALLLENEAEALFLLDNGETKAFQTIFRRMGRLRGEGHTKFRF